MFRNPLRLIKTKKIKKMGIIILLSIVTFTGIYTFYVSNLSYAVIFNGKEIGITKDKEEVNVMMESINQEFDDRYGEFVEADPEVSYEQVWAINNETDSIETIALMAEKTIGLKSDAYAFNVDGKDLFFLNSEADANKIIERLKEEIVTKVEIENIKEVNIVEDIKIIPKSVDSNEIIGNDEAFELIVEGSEAIREYAVNKGDTASQIAVDHDISLADIEAANQDINTSKLQIGQVVKLNVPEPLITVKIIEEKEYIESIPYDVKYVETSNLYKGDTKVSFIGSEGAKEIKSEVTYVNGIITDEKIIDEKIIEEPSSKIVLKGTASRPKTLAYGTFKSPTRGSGRISSKFGPRWGGYHKGVDIANPIGTPIAAADGGKVIFSGWKGDYGYIVIIDHENGYHTYYAHCSKILVSKNTRVYRGQTIAKVGSTGNSTGPHLHFEVRKNGVPVDPLKYIN